MLGYSRKILCTLLTAFLGAINLQAQVLIGITGGFQIPGAQDLKFKHFDQTLVLGKTIHTNRVASGVSSFNGFTVTVFGKKNFWNHNGIRIESAHWEFDSKSKRFFGDTPPPINEAEQYRTGILVSLLHKFSCPSFMNNWGYSEGYGYIGIGSGVVLTDVDPGKRQWHIGVQALAGVAIPINNKFNGTVELKYLITHDADNIVVDKPGWFVDTSGTLTWLRLGPHLDTRFLTLQLGVQWAVFYNIRK